jgi:hypothetical protein
MEVIELIVGHLETKAEQEIRTILWIIKLILMKNEKYYFDTSKMLFAQTIYFNG